MGCWEWLDGGAGVLGQNMGLIELFPVSPQVMETHQVPRSPRVRLLLLLLLLVPWGHHAASGIALPPAGVFRYSDVQVSQEGVGTQWWEETQREWGGTQWNSDLEGGGQRCGVDRE